MQDSHHNTRYKLFLDKPFNLISGQLTLVESTVKKRHTLKTIIIVIVLASLIGLIDKGSGELSKASSQVLSDITGQPLLIGLVFTVIGFWLLLYPLIKANDVVHVTEEGLRFLKDYRLIEGKQYAGKDAVELSWSAVTQFEIRRNIWDTLYVFETDKTTYELSSPLLANAPEGIRYKTTSIKQIATSVGITPISKMKYPLLATFNTLIALIVFSLPIFVKYEIAKIQRELLQNGPSASTLPNQSSQPVANTSTMSSQDVLLYNQRRKQEVIKDVENTLAKLGPKASHTSHMRYLKSLGYSVPIPREALTDNYVLYSTSAWNRWGKDARIVVNFSLIYGKHSVVTDQHSYVDLSFTPLPPITICEYFGNTEILDGILEYWDGTKVEFYEALYDWDSHAILTRKDCN